MWVIPIPILGVLETTDIESGLAWVALSLFGDLGAASLLWFFEAIESNSARFCCINLLDNTGTNCAAW